MNLNPLSTPDLCAHLDRLKSLCDRLEETQGDPDAYRDLVHKIRLETEAFQAAICGVSADSTEKLSAGITAAGNPRGN